jgi:transcription elongation factor GreB
MPATTPNYITPEGLKKIQDELHQLLHVERPQLVKTISWAAGNGDRSENADYIYGKRRLREIDKRVHFLTTRLDNIEVIDPAKLSGTKVSFGATVTLIDETDKKACYQIIGVDEIDTSGGKISWQSPLAKALLGKSQGETVMVVRPAGKIEVEILKVEYK